MEIGEARDHVACPSGRGPCGWLALAALTPRKDVDASLKNGLRQSVAAIVHTMLTGSITSLRTERCTHARSAPLRHWLKCDHS